MSGGPHRRPARGGDALGDGGTGGVCGAGRCGPPLRMGRGRIGVAEQCRPRPRRDPAPPPCPTVQLNNGVEIPQLGFGVFQIPPEDTAGHRDRRPWRSATGTSTPRRCTATRRGRRGRREPGLDRDEIFVTSKLNNNRLTRDDDALRSFDQTWPTSASTSSTCSSSTGRCPAWRLRRAWKAMEEIYADGRVRAIGVSNFQPHHLRTLFEATEVRPGGQPDRGAPLPDPGRAPRLRRRARDRHRGLGADRPGQGRSTTR